MKDETAIKLILACNDEELVQLERSKRFEDANSGERGENPEEISIELIRVYDEYVIIKYEYFPYNEDEIIKSIDYFENADEAIEKFENLIKYHGNLA